MSNYAYKGKDFEISRAQAVQALASRIEISPDLNPILLKPLGDYRSSIFLRGKFYKKKCMLMTITGSLFKKME